MPPDPSPPVTSVVPDDADGYDPKAYQPFGGKSPYTDGTPDFRPQMLPGMLWQDIGSSGLRQYSGWIREEFLRALQGREAARVYREMRDNSATIGALMFAIHQTMRKIDWKEERQSDDAAQDFYTDFAHSLRFDMSQGWNEFVAEALSMLEFGFASHEIVYKRRQGQRKPMVYDVRGRPMLAGADEGSSNHDDGLIGIRRMPLRGQETILRWYFDPNGQITGMQQQPWQGPLIDIPIEKLLIFRPQYFKGNPEGRSILRNAYRCFSEDTEVLAETGWKLFRDLLPKERVATLNRVTDELEYQEPTKNYRYWYEGKMFHQGGRWVDQLVTPNHNMYIDRRTGKGFEFIEALDQKRTVWYKRNAIWVGEEWDTFLLPEYRRTQGVRDGTHSYNGERELVWEAKHIAMDSWLKFFGFWLAEGYTTRNKRGQRFVGISQNPGEVLEDIIAVVKECGFNPIINNCEDRSTVKVEVCDAQLYEYLVQFGGSYDKCIPQELKKLSKRQLNILFDAMWEGDGGWSGYETTKTYATVAKKLADDVSEILLKIGYAPIVRRQKGSDGSGSSFRNDGCWIISAVKGISDGNRVNFSRDDREWVDYDGEVFCLEVPNHTLYVRRDGKASWSGNCYFFSKRIEEEEAILFERMNGFPVLKVPQELLEAAAGTGPAAAQASQTLEYYKKLITNVRIDEQMGVILPSNTFMGANGPSNVPMYEFELMLPKGAGGHSVDSEKVLGRYSLDILKTVMADFIDLGHQARGTQNLAISKVDMFFQGISGWLTAMADVLNKYMLPRVWRLNGWSSDTVPQYVPDLAQRIDLEAISNFVLRLSQAGARLFPDDDLENYLRDAAGMPSLDDDADYQPLQTLVNPASQVITPPGSTGGAKPVQGTPTGGAGSGGPLAKSDGPPELQSPGGQVADAILFEVAKEIRRQRPAYRVQGDRAKVKRRTVVRAAA